MVAYSEGDKSFADDGHIKMDFSLETPEERKLKVDEIIDNYEFKHNAHTEAGISGSPIILPITLKVIGIHKQGHKNLPFNYGSFIGEIFNKNTNSLVVRLILLTIE